MATPQNSPATPCTPATSYDLAGGAGPIDGIASRFSDRVLADPLLLPLFDDPTGDHPARMALFLAELLGGPARHSAKRGGSPRIADAHVGPGIDEQQRRRWPAHMLPDVREAGLPQAVLDELPGPVGRYRRRGTPAAPSHSEVR